MGTATVRLVSIATVPMTLSMERSASVMRARSLADGAVGLGRAHRMACAASDVTAAVRFELSPGTLERSGRAAVLRTALVVERLGRGAITVTDVRGTILFSVDAPPDAPLAALPESAARASVALTVTALRCDAHALTESKTSFTFPVYAALDGAEPALVQVTATGPSRASLQVLLDTSCAGAPLDG